MGRKRKEKILIIDGYTLERASMKALLSTHSRIGNIGEAGTTEQAKQQLEQKAFDLLIYSLISFEENEVAALKKVIALVNDRPIMVLGPDADAESILSLVQAGVRGYVTKQQSKDELLQGVVSLLDGEKFFPSSKTEKIRQVAEKVEKEVISHREKEILVLVISGMNNNRIGEQLNISVRTVENHRANMMRKLNVKNTAELVKKAITEKLVDF